MYRHFGKRLLDIVVSSAALVALSPLMCIVAFAIFVESGRPVLFRQERPGRHGKPFIILKFRSMANGTAAMPSDLIQSPPITKVGRVIRRLNLDELPQLVNILRGDMSLVGPRPPLATQEELLRLRADGGSLSLRPGLTGLAQVQSYDGMAVETKVQFDNQYASMITLPSDMRIVARTFIYLLRPPPKY